MTRAGLRARGPAGPPDRLRAPELRVVPAAASCAPWNGSGPAATDAVRYLHRRFGLDLWLMTQVDLEAHTVLAAAGPWAGLTPPGTVLPWSASFCRPMAAGEGPCVAPDVQAVPACTRAAQGLMADVRSCLRVPIVDADSRLIGTLCAVSGTRRMTDLAEALEPARLVGRMLSTVLAGEALARTRAEETASACVGADRDPLTGLRNRAGWESALADEHARCHRHGGPASVLVVHLDESKDADRRAGDAARDDVLVRCAALLADGSRPADVVARLDGDQFAVLAVQCDVVCVRALQTRLRVRLRTEGIGASVGCTTRWAGEDLAHTWQRADRAMRCAERRRSSLREPARTAT